MEHMLLLHLKRLSITGNTDQLTQKQFHLNKRRRRNLEKRMHSILKNYQMLMVFMTLKTGFNQILAVKIWFVVLLLDLKHLLSEEWVVLSINTHYHIFNLIISYNWGVDHNKCTWIVIQLDSQSLISWVSFPSSTWMLRQLKETNKAWVEWAVEEKESILLTKEKKSGPSCGLLTIQNYVQSWRKIDSLFWTIINKKNQSLPQDTFVTFQIFE